MVDISIPEDLFKKIEDRIKGTEFDSVSEYVVFVLREVVCYEHEECPEEDYSPGEDEIVKERLRDLGYID